MIRKLLHKQGMISSLLTAFFLLLNLVIVRLQVDALGLENYGVIVILFSVFGTINLINSGVGSALVAHYSAYREEGLFWRLYFWVFCVFFTLSFAIIAVGALLKQFTF